MLKIYNCIHNVKEEQIQQLKTASPKKTVLFSEKKKQLPISMFIIDTIILTKIYSYADVRMWAAVW
jgi:hypothetical protein